MPNEPAALPPNSNHTRTFGRWWREVIAPWWRDFQWPVMGVLALIAVSLGHWGYWIQFRGTPEAAYSFWDILYLDLQLFLLQMGNVEPPFNAALDFARFLAPAVAGYTALQALGELFASELQSLRLRFLRGHVVICGLGRKGLILARGFIERGQSVVVIEQDAENDLIPQCRDLGAAVLTGDASEEWLLKKAGVGRAAHLLALCGGDGINAEVAVRAAQIVSRNSGPQLTCVLHIFDTQLCTLLRERELDAATSGRLRMVFFNVFELGARTLLEESPVCPPGGDAASESPRLVIVGLGLLGESLLVNAARQWHGSRRSLGSRLHVTLIDLRAKEILVTWLVRYPALQNVCTIVPLDMDIHSATFQKAEFLEEVNPNGDPPLVFVCLDDESLGLTAALALTGRNRERESVLVVRMAQEAGLAILLQDMDDTFTGIRQLRTFALLDRTCDPDQVMQGGTREILARGIHEQYLQQQAKAGMTHGTNPSMVPWEALPPHLKASNREQADDIGAKLKAVQCGVSPLVDWDEPAFEFAEPEIEELARMEHDRWMAEKKRAGWRPCPVRDDREKLHPSLIPFDELPPDEQEKDRHAVRGIPAMLARVGFRVHRLSKRECIRSSD